MPVILLLRLVEDVPYLNPTFVIGNSAPLVGRIMLPVNVAPVLVTAVAAVVVTAGEEGGTAVVLSFDVVSMLSFLGDTPEIFPLTKETTDVVFSLIYSGVAEKPSGQTT